MAYTHSYMVYIYMYPTTVYVDLYGIYSRYPLTQQKERLGSCTGHRASLAAQGPV